LLDRAFALGGKITPETLIKAHRDMAEQLLGQATAEDAATKKLGKSPDPLYRLEIAKLQQTFVETVQSTDYVEVNKKRNVAIEEVEPGLSRFATPVMAPEAAAPAVREGQGGPAPAQVASKRASKPSSLS
jgi:hypothetical protein